MKKVIIITVVLALVAVGGFGVYKVVNKNDAPATTSEEHDHTTHSHDTESQPAASNTEEANAEVTITYNDSGYSPAMVTVKTGGRVTVKNESSRIMQFDSDPHPAHTANRELNAESIAPGKSETFTVTKIGTFGYHNHLNEDETGTIIVQ